MVAVKRLLAALKDAGILTDTTVKSVSMTTPGGDTLKFTKVAGRGNCASVTEETYGKESYAYITVRCSNREEHQEHIARIRRITEILRNLKATYELRDFTYSDNLHSFNQYASHVRFDVRINTIKGWHWWE